MKRFSYKSSYVAFAYQDISMKTQLLLLRKNFGLGRSFTSLIIQILDYEGGKVVFKIIVCIAMCSLMMNPIRVTYHDIIITK